MSLERNVRPRLGVYHGDRLLRDTVPHNPSEGNLLSRHDIDEWMNLNDHQKLLHAYDTETRVRLAAARGLPVHASVEENLFPIYYDPYDSERGYPVGYPRVMLERDVINYRRRRHQYFRQHAATDESVHPCFIDLGHIDDENLPLSSCITPCYLFFLIILEGYCGYRMHSRPGSAIMGGAVVACLTAWKCPVLRSIIMNSNIIPYLAAYDDIPFRSDADRSYDGDPTNFILTDSYWDYPVHPNEIYWANPGDDTLYREHKRELVREINNYFIFRFASCDPSINLRNRHILDSHDSTSFNMSHSTYSTGDVDIFIEKERGIEVLPGMNQDILKLIGDYVGPMGLSTPDVINYTSSFFSNIYGEMAEFLGFLEEHAEEASAGIIFSVTKRALSFEVTMDHEYRDPSGRVGARLWPRNTQFIHLHSNVSLLLALMDFDLSTVTCMHNGSGVYCTFRGAFSLKTQSCVVTPIVYEEKRCRTRLAKYHRRGYSRLVFDPRILHPPLNIRPAPISHSIDTSLVRQADIYHNARIVPRDHYNEDVAYNVNQFQTRSDTFKVCCLGQQNPCRGTYSLSLIPGQLDWKINFLSSFLSWPSEHEEFVRNIDTPHRLLVCAYVKNAILASLNMDVLSQNGIILDSDGTHIYEGLQALDTEMANLHWVSNEYGTSTSDHRSDQTFYAGPVSSAKNARCTKGINSSRARYHGKQLFDWVVFRQRNLPNHPAGASIIVPVTPPDSNVNPLYHGPPSRHNLLVTHPHQPIYTNNNPQGMSSSHPPRPNLLKSVPGFLPRFLYGTCWRDVLEQDSLLRELSSNPIGLNPERICRACSNCGSWEKMVLLPFNYDVCDVCSNE